MASKLQPAVEKLMVQALGKRKMEPKTLVLDSGVELHVSPAQCHGDYITLKFMRGHLQTEIVAVPPNKNCRAIQKAAHELAKFVDALGCNLIADAIRNAAQPRQLELATA